MGVNKSSDRYFIVPSGSVMTTGFSANLAKGQIGLFDILEVGKFGAKAVDSLAGKDKRAARFEIRYGIGNGVSRTLSDKPAKTMTFSLSDVTKAWVGRPHVTEQKFDEWYLGYDGFDTTKSFVFRPGDTTEVDLIIYGKPLGYLNQGKLDQFIAKGIVSIPENMEKCQNEDACEPVSCKKPTLELVEYFNNYTLPSGDKLSKFFYINPVLSSNQAGILTGYTLYSLEYCGSDDVNAIGLVQAQYPDTPIVRDSLTGKLQMLLPTSAGAPDDFVTSLPNIIPGCSGCPNGFDTIDGGFIYAVKMEDGGADLSESITFGEAKKTGNNYNVGYYLVNSETKLTAAEIEELLVDPVEETADDPAVEGIGATSTITFLGEKGAICENPNEIKVEWVEEAVGNATTKTFEIILADDCNGSRLDELKAAYPDLTITAAVTPAPANCIRKYTTTVLTDVVFPEGCPTSTAIVNVYKAEAPKPFQVNTYWVESAESEDSNTYSCGLRIKAKPVIVNASGDCLVDELPFIATSMRVKVAGGYITNKYLNGSIYNKPMASLQTNFAADLDNLGGNMRNFEREGRFYFLNETYFNNPTSRALTGSETQIEGLTQYSTYAFEVNKHKKAQAFGGYALDSKVVHMIVPTNQADAVEELLNTIAAGADIPVEQL